MHPAVWILRIAFRNKTIIYCAKMEKERGRGRGRGRDGEGEGLELSGVER